MTWWGYALVYGGLSINLGSLAINWLTILRTRRLIERLDEIVRQAKLLGYQQGYRDGSVK